MNAQTPDSQLMSRLNRRDIRAFSEVYSELYECITAFAYNFFSDTVIEPTDAVQDAFISMWHSDARFSSLNEIKSYLYITIKNHYNYQLRRKIIKKRYLDQQELRTHFEENIVESELYFHLRRAIESLPAENARIMKLYIEGFDTDQIAEMLHYKRQTIYNKRHQSIELLRTKISKEVLSFLLTIA